MTTIGQSRSIPILLKLTSVGVIEKLNLEQNQEAIIDYDLAISIEPNNAFTYFNRGNAKEALGQKQEAIADYNRAIAIDPKFAPAYGNYVVREALNFADCQPRY